jgi:hypothetical protein
MASPSCSSRMTVRSWPEARRPGPRGPDESSPTGGRARRAAWTSADMWLSCQRISSSTASGRLGFARPTALAAYAAAPSACAPMWQTATAWPAARAAAAAAGAFTSPAPTPPANRRRIPSAAFSSPRAKARALAMRARGRSSSGSSASKSASTLSAQSAAHAATARRSVSLSVCGDRTTPVVTDRTQRPSTRRPDHREGKAKRDPSRLDAAAAAGPSQAFQGHRHASRHR